MKVFYINHYGVWGGAQRSMVEMIRNFPPGDVSPIVLTPEGRIERILENAGVEYITVKGIAKIDHTRVGYYKSWRWIILLRELWYLLFTVVAFLTNRKKIISADIVHVNENTCIIPVILAKKLYNKKTVMHARAVMNNDQKLFRTRFIGKWIRKYVDVLVAIDENVSESLPSHPRTLIIHNGLTITKDHVVDQNLQNKLKEKNKRKLNLGFVGALDKNKGIYDLIEAMKVCIEQNLDVNLYVLGNSLESARGMTSKKSLGVKGKDVSVHEDPVAILIDRYLLKDYIHLLGFSSDIHSFYKFIDVVCFPSYYNAPGRPVFEAAWFGKPSILAVTEPKPDTFMPGITGLQVMPGDVGTIVEAIKLFYFQENLKTKLGKGALELAKENFDSKKNAAEMLKTYRELMAQ